MKHRIGNKELSFFGNKKGQSPGALMTDGDKVYLVKLGIPRAHGRYELNSYEDVAPLINEMSRRACDEKIFFNIAEAVGNNKYMLPKTDIVFINPSKYSRSSCSVYRKLAKKFHVENISSSIDESPINIVIEQINSAEIAHFVSEIITPYHDIGEFYKYHVEEAQGDMRQIEYQRPGVPGEPLGMGAFFALSCFTGNYDCIGNTGANAGVSPDTFKVIIVDGGISRMHKEVITDPMPVSSNHQQWLGYLDLSPAAQREASETFARIANLEEPDIRDLITNNGQFTAAGVFTPSEITNRLKQFKEQQLKIVEVFYDSMLKEDYATPRIIRMKEKLDFIQAKLQSDAAMNLYKKKRKLEVRVEEDNATSSESVPSPEFPIRKVRKTDSKSLKSSHIPLKRGLSCP